MLRARDVVWDKARQSLQILIIVPGQEELWEVQRALMAANFSFPHRLEFLHGETLQDERQKISR